MNKPVVILSLGVDTSKDEMETIEEIFISDDYSLEIRLSIVRASDSGLSLLIDAVIFNILSSILWDTIKLIYAKLASNKKLNGRPLELKIRRTWGEIYMTKKGFYVNKGKEHIEFGSIESVIEYAISQEKEEN